VDLDSTSHYANLKKKYIVWRIILIVKKETGHEDVKVI
jgi:hypothetical protein